MNKLIILLLSTVFLTTGCVSMKTVQNKILQIENGMSKQEVRNLLGDPRDRRFDDEFEEWEYSFADTLYGEVKVILVRFTDDRVTGMETFNPKSVAPLPPSPPHHRH